MRAFVLLDLGSAVSLINQSFLIDHHFTVRRVGGDIVLNTCAGSVSVCWVATGNNQVLDFRKGCQVLVLKGLPYDLILGVDFLRGTPFYIDLEKFLITRNSGALSTALKIVVVETEGTATTKDRNQVEATESQGPTKLQYVGAGNSVEEIALARR